MQLRSEATLPREEGPQLSGPPVPFFSLSLSLSLSFSPFSSLPPPRLSRVLSLLKGPGLYRTLLVQPVHGRAAMPPCVHSVPRKTRCASATKIPSACIEGGRDELGELFMVADRDAASRQRCLRGNRPTHWHSCLQSACPSSSPRLASFCFLYPSSAHRSLPLLFLLVPLTSSFVSRLPLVSSLPLPASRLYFSPLETRRSSFSTFLDTFVRHGPHGRTVTGRRTNREGESCGKIF